MRAVLPRLAGWSMALVGAVNVLSVTTPQLPRRLELPGLLALSGLVLAAPNAVLPVGIALLVLAAYLTRRRRRALWIAVALLATVGGLDLLKGFDLKEAAFSWALAGLLVWGRSTFTARHENGTLGRALRRAVLVAGATVATAGIAVTIASHWVLHPLTVAAVAGETARLLLFDAGPLRFPDAFAWVPFGIWALSAGALLAVAWTLFRPLRAPREPMPEPVRALARDLVRAHGHDTLSFFKLRGDVQSLFSPDGRAFLSYRVRNGVLVVSGDPVGAPDAVPALLRRAGEFAAERGLRVTVIGASEECAAIARRAGLHSLYLGDEAIVDTAGFSLEGRRIKKVRQAVHRLQREGYRAELRRAGDLTAAELDELDAVSARWRAGAPERGFSMAMEGLRGDHLADSTVVVARDGDGRARGFLHFVPSYGRAAMSLSAMRRDRDTPNGLTDFLVVTAIQELGARGTAELSLNFAAFARWLNHPSGRSERALAWVIRRANPFFQIESLYQYNAKFSPRWQPRYLLHEGVTTLPRAALAALSVEGQLPTFARRADLRVLAS